MQQIKKQPIAYACWLLKIHSHLFFESSFFNEVWSVICTWMSLQIPAQLNLTVTWLLTRGQCNKVRKYILKAVVAASVYEIWCERNRRSYFINEACSSSMIVKNIIQQIHVRAGNRRKSGVQRFCSDVLNFYPS